MALFADEHRLPEPSANRSGRWGGWVLGTSIVGVFVFALVPSPYVIEKPGPVFDTLGAVTIDGQDVPMISIPDERTYPTDGTLDLLTVSAVGSRESLPNWFEVTTAWFDPSKAVLPVDEVYPPGTTVEQSNEDARIQMQNSQKDAIAAAMTHLGYDLPRRVLVGGFSPDSPSEGILQQGDQLISINGETFQDVESLRAVIARGGAGNPLSIDLSRDGVMHTVSVTPVLSDGDNPVPIVGIYPSIEYEFPFEVNIQLQNVGGPSGGQMFALGIIDKLTPGKLNGGADVAGTGTIDAEGTIGPIGGIRQKLYGALDSGAEWFLAPKSNCREVVGHVPEGLRVVAVSTLEDSLNALEVISSGASTAALPSCSAG